MRAEWMLVLAIGFAGCTKGGGETDDTSDGDADTDTDADTDSDTDADTDSDTDADTDSDTDTDTDSDTDTDTDTDSDPPGAPNEVLTGNIEDGEVPETLSWASNINACWPGSSDEYFDGRHVYIVVDKEDQADIYVKLEPEAGKNLSLFVMEFSGEPDVPPDADTSIARCEIGVGALGPALAGAGAPEAIVLQGFATRTMVVGVAGADELGEGDYTVKVWKGDADTFDTGL